MNRMLKYGMALVCMIFTFLSSGCALQRSSVQTITPEEKSELLRWSLRELGKAGQPYCWRRSYGRGVGAPVSACPKGQEKDAGLCYPECEDIGRQGWKGVGPVCWQRCPSGFRDDGAYCFKPEAYGRGVGFPWKIGDKAFSLSNAKKRCERKYGEDQCEKSGAIYYPRCKPGYRAIGCCVCSPRCPSGMTDIGISCQKQSKGRGVGKPMKCRDGEAYDAGLCYKPCRESYHGVGPICWQDCPSTQPANCGAGCAISSGQCADKTIRQVLAPLEVALNVAMAVTTGGSANATVQAAKVSAKTAARTAGKEVARETLRKSTKLMAREMVPDIRKKLKEKLREYSDELAEEIYENAAESLAEATLANDSPDIKDLLMALDPTGIAAVTDVFTNPKCSFDEAPPSFGR